VEFEETAAGHGDGGDLDDDDDGEVGSAVLGFWLGLGDLRGAGEAARWVIGEHGEQRLRIGDGVGVVNAEGTLATGAGVGGDLEEDFAGEHGRGKDE
jgi:hypothetical protein